MTASRQTLRRRMHAVGNTKKITRAMQMLAVNKFSRNLNRLKTNIEHNKYIKEIMQKILWGMEEMDGVYLQENNVAKKAVIVFTSDIGLCGSYNQNLMQMITAEVDSEDIIVVIGKKGHAWLTERGYNVINPIIGIEEVSENQLKRISDRAVQGFVDEKVSSVKLIYTKYVNPLVSEPKMLTLLPLTKEERYANSQREIIFEPSEAITLEYLVPLYLDTVIYSYMIESIVSEQSARRVSMDKATDNADSLLESLERTYHKTRQAQITQEVSEIVSGSRLGKDGL